MYTLYVNAGIVVRTADGVQVAPTSDMQNQDYLDWLAWCDAGNSPTLGVEAPATAAYRPISKLGFLNRFTSSELIAIELAKIHDPNSSTATQQLAAALRVQQHQFDVAQVIDLGHQQTIDGVTQLETVGLIGSGRALAIISAEITPDEIA